MPKNTVHGGASNADLPAEPEPTAAESEPAPAAAAEAPEPVGVAVDYPALTVEELRERLRNRGLSTSGTKAELVARLEADDLAEEG